MSHSDFEQISEHLDLDGVITLTQELVRIPSPIGQEKAVAEFIAAKLTEIGVPNVKLIEGEPGRPNIVAEIQSENNVPGLLLYGHIDSEFVSPHENWICDPYGGEIIEGKLYGRASKDMRGGIAAFIKVVEALLKSKIKLNKNLVMTFVVDEETAGDMGIGYVLKQGIVKAEVGIQAETYRFGDIMIADSGAIWFEVITKGKAQHCQLNSKNRFGVNAVAKMAKIITALDQLDLNSKAHPLYPGMSPCITAGTTIESRVGQHPNMIPDLCKATFDVRILPGQSVDEVMGLISQTISQIEKEDGTFESEIKLIRSRIPTEVKADDPFVKLVADKVLKVTGEPGVIRGHEITSDHNHLRGAGIKSVHMGPGNLTAHTPNEYIEVDQLIAAAKIYALVAYEYLCK